MAYSYTVTKHGDCRCPTHKRGLSQAGPWESVLGRDVTKVECSTPGCTLRAYAESSEGPIWVVEVRHES